MIPLGEEQLPPLVICYIQLLEGFSSEYAYFSYTIHFLYLPDRTHAPTEATAIRLALFFNMPIKSSGYPASCSGITLKPSSGSPVGFGGSLWLYGGVGRNVGEECWKECWKEC